VGKERQGVGGEAHERAPRWVDVGLVVGFLALAAWFVWGSPTFEPPSAATPAVAASDLSTDPIRGEIPHEPLITIGSFTRRCNECHKLFESAEETPRRLTEHQHIVLDHGLNDRCHNCHDRGNHERLAVRGGPGLTFAEVPRLCAGCHGPTYRDWERGMHGRSSGSWDPGSPEQNRLLCSDCHDPHAPAFEPLRPLPAPNTLRMGPAGKEHETPVDDIDPLRKWRRPHAGDSEEP
jgi:hypothetical protein